MKKVLIIAHAFPPDVSIGAQRPYRLAKYLPLYGWEPTVLTAEQHGCSNDGIRVIGTEYKDFAESIKSIIGLNSKEGLHEQLGITRPKNINNNSWKSNMIKFIRELVEFPDRRRRWISIAEKTASNLLEKELYNIIISTSSPVSSHLLARKLKQKYKIAWVADLRDLWTQNHFYNKYGLIEYFERRLELNTLSDANALVTVTPQFVKNLSMLHKNKQIICITNGYDHSDYLDIKTKLTKNLTITYTGGMYDGRMDPSMLFQVISSLINNELINKDLIEVRFYLKENEGWLLKKIREYRLEGVIKCYDRIPRNEALSKQKESQLLLLLVDRDTDVDYYPAKLFEYIGAKRPIISLGGKGGVVKKLLEETNAGIFIENSRILKDKLLDYYREFIKCGEVKSLSNRNDEKYTYRSIAKIYSQTLDSIINN